MSKIYLMNSPVLTAYGAFNFQKITLEEAKEILKEGFVSAIGHEATAKLLTQLLGLEVKNNRIQVTMATGDVAIVFRLKTRLAEGQILSLEEIAKLDYEFGLLQCIKTL